MRDGQWKDPRYIFFAVIALIILIGFIISQFGGGGGNHSTNVMPAPTKTINKYVRTNTDNPSVPAGPPASTPSKPDYSDYEAHPTEGKSGIPIWTTDQAAPSFEVVNGANQSAASLTTDAYKKWYPNFTKFVNRFGQTYTDAEKKDWAKDIQALTAPAYLGTVQKWTPSTYIPATPKSFKIIRAGDNWVTAFVSYDHMDINVEFAKDMKRPNDDWKMLYLTMQAT